MIFGFFTFLIIVSETILAVTVFIYLFKLNMAIIEANEILIDSRPKIKDLMELVEKISEQLTELAPIFVENVRKKRNLILYELAKKVVSSIVFCGINIAIAKKFKILKKLKYRKFLSWLLRPIKI